MCRFGRRATSVVYGASGRVFGAFFPPYFLPSAAASAAAKFLAEWTEGTGGNEYGEPMYCGFAWINIYGIKGNTKLGKRFKAAGVERSYDGSLQIYNPSGHRGQSMDVKEAGAEAAANVFTKYGFKCYAGSRAD